MFFIFVSDVVEWILENLINTSRSQRGVKKKLRELGYDVGSKVSTLLYPKSMLMLSRLWHDCRQGCEW
jgi:hypothetical protein